MHSLVVSVWCAMAMLSRGHYTPALAVFLVLLAAAPRLASASAGDLDLTFHGDGLLLGSEEPKSPKTTRHVVKTPQGGAVAVGFNSEIVRYTPSGALDPGFGVGGYVSVASVLGVTRSVAVDSNGRIAVLGEHTREQNIRVVRLNPSGQLDGDFGHGGLVEVTAPELRGAEVIGIDPEGRILIAGSTLRDLPTKPYFSWDLVIARFSSTGDRDDGFGSMALARVPFRRQVIPTAIAFGEDSALFVAGAHPRDGLSADAGVLVKVAASGAVDATFGDQGVVFDVIPLNEFVGLSSNTFRVIVQVSGRILFAGPTAAIVEDTCCGILSDCQTCIPKARAAIGVARLKPSGELDDAFGEGGIATAPFFYYDRGRLLWVEAALRGLTVQPDGKILVSGTAMLDFFDFAVARITTTGALDATFGEAGTVIVDIPEFESNGTISRTAFAHVPIPQSDGAILVAGWAEGHEVVLARLEGDRCGNGSVEDGEECDDGNMAGGDGCDGSCLEEGSSTSTSSTVTTTTTTSSSSSSTTSTTPPCDARCVIEAALGSPACAQAHVPGKLRNALSGALEKVERAPSVGDRRAKRLIGRARSLLNRARRETARLSKQGTDATVCGEELRRSIEQVASDLRRGA